MKSLFAMGGKPSTAQQGNNPVADTGMECCICYESLMPRPVADGEAGQEEAKGVCTTRCGHVFHEDCITKWVRENPTCPACRKVANLDSLLKIFLEGQSNGEERCKKCHKNKERYKEQKKASETYYAQYEQITKQLRVLRKERDDLKLKLEELQKMDIGIAKQTIDQNAEQIRVLGAERDELKLKVGRLEVSLNILKRDNDQRATEIGAMRVEREVMQRALNNRKETNEKNSEHIRVLETQRDQLQQRIAATGKLEADLKDARQTIEHNTIEIRVLKNDRDELQLKREELKKLEADLKSAKQTNEQNTNEIGLLKKERDELKLKLQERKDSVTKTSKQINEQNTEEINNVPRKERDELKPELQDKRSLEADLNKAKQTIDKNAEQIRVLQIERDQLLGKLRKFQDSKPTTEQTTEQVRALQVERDELKQKVERITNNMVILRRDYDEEKKTKDEMFKENVVLRKEKDELQLQLKQLVASITESDKDTTVGTTNSKIRAECVVRYIEKERDELRIKLHKMENLEGELKAEKQANMANTAQIMALRKERDELKSKLQKRSHQTSSSPTSSITATPRRKLFPKAKNAEKANDAMRKEKNSGVQTKVLNDAMQVQGQKKDPATSSPVSNTTTARNDSKIPVLKKEKTSKESCKLMLPPSKNVNSKIVNKRKSVTKPATQPVPEEGLLRRSARIKKIPKIDFSHLDSSPSP